jgi:hypothetical protein
MNEFKKRMLAAAIIAGLGMIGYLMNSQQAVAQQPGPPDGLAVRIVNPVPVPVTGSTTVSGTVAATQSGTWNVGITGTPNVGITGTPNVNVTNPATAPVLTLDISKSAGQVVELQCLRSLAPTPVCEEVPGPSTPTAAYVVPKGQNLVVNSVDITPDNGGGTASFFISRPQQIGSTWFVPQDGFTHSFQYPSGIVFRAGYTFDGTVVFLSSATAIVRGFLAPI